MRDAVGGTFMIKLILVFLAVYIIFMGAALNYAKAFRVKNKVMDIIEQNEGMEEADFNNLSGTNNLGVTGKINEYLSTVSYNVSLTDKNKENKGVCFDRGYCIDKKESTNVDGVYLVDSYGSLYPEQIRALSDKYVDAMDAAGKYVGIHAHNNQQLAFANTIESMARGVSLLDATMSSMGRGAGNCAMELLLGFLKNPKYNLFPVLKFVETQMMALKEQGVVWGYDIPYFLTGRLNLHPSSAIDCMKAGRTDYTDFYTELLDRS